MAMWQIFGPPDAMTTVNPYESIDVDLRLHLNQLMPENVTATEKAKRRKAITSNPTSVTEWFLNVMESFIYIFVGFDL